MAVQVDPLCRLPDGVTDLHARYRKCATVRNREEAEEFLEELAHDFVDREGGSLPEALRVERANIGYWAGCYLRWTETLRVFRFFHTSSPVFGDYHPEVHEAFWAGVRVAMEMRGREVRREEIAEMKIWTGGLHRWKEKG